MVSQNTNAQTQGDKVGSPFAGLDRKDLLVQDSGRKVSALDAWMAEMYQKSNFDFCNVFLTLKDDSHKNKAGENEITKSARNEEEHQWPQVVPKLIEQGWGLLFFYVGYSIRLDMPSVAPPELLELNKFPHNIDLKKHKKLPTKSPGDFFQDDLANERGRLHGAHLRRAVSHLSGDHDGAVAFLDNEGSSNPVPGTLITYFTALFDEMRRPGSENEPQAIRPGLYTFDVDAEIVLPLDGFEDVFLWRIDNNNPGRSKWLSPRAISTASRPWEITSGQDKRLRFDIEDFPMRPMALENKTPGQGSEWALPVGGQVLLAEEFLRPGRPRMFMPNLGKPMSGTLVPVADWDLSISLVRDPRYPEANPRFKLVGDSLIRGDFRKLAKDGPPSPRVPNAITMVVRDALNAQADPIEETNAGPEAPIILPTQDLLLTINKNGQIAASSRTKGKWGKLASLSGGRPLRRLRAMTATPAGLQGIQLFYISQDRRIQARRLASDGKWSDSAVVAGGLITHPFTNIESIYLPGESVDVFFIGSNGLLHVATWPTKSDSKDWPAQQGSVLPDQKPVRNRSAILPGTAIAAVTSLSEHELVFTVGRDFHLQMAVFTKGGKWTPVTSIGGENERLFAHTRLAAYLQPPGIVLVAAISHEGDPVVYKLQLKGGSWNKDAPRIKQSVETDPPGWAINPFSDLQIGQMDGDTVLLCAGTMPGKTALLMKSLYKDKSGKWKIIPTSFPDDVGSG